MTIINACIFSLYPAPSQPPSGLSATILSSSSLSISWMSVSGADGYIVYYNGGEAVLIEGQDSTNSIQTSEYIRGRNEAN